MKSCDQRNSSALRALRQTGGYQFRVHLVVPVGRRLDADGRSLCADESPVHKTENGRVSELCHRGALQ